SDGAAATLLLLLLGDRRANGSQHGRELLVGEILEGHFLEAVFLREQRGDESEIIVKPLIAQPHDRPPAVLPEVGGNRGQERLAKQAADGGRIEFAVVGVAFPMSCHGVTPMVAGLKRMVAATLGTRSCRGGANASARPPFWRRGAVP